jgi:hypothetical protein
MAENKANIKAVKKIMNRTYIKITMKYFHSGDSRIEAVEKWHIFYPRP